MRNYGRTDPSTPSRGKYLKIRSIIISEIIMQKVENLPVYIFNTRQEMGIKAPTSKILKGKNNG